MTTLRHQTEAQFNKTRENNPEFARTVDNLLNDAKAFGQGKSALNTGCLAPDFILPDALGVEVSLKALLSKGRVVVTFYRGSWCPYCNLQLRALSLKVPEIHKLGAEVVAISPQIPDESMSIVEKQGLTFPVLSDYNAKVAETFGVAWPVPQMLVKHMREDRGLDLERINGGNDSVLPIPATFIINQDGGIAWRFVDIDYRNRCEPEDIIEQLTLLSLRSLS